jgi:hypothetical protein
VPSSSTGLGFKNGTSNSRLHQNKLILHLILDIMHKNTLCPRNKPDFRNLRGAKMSFLLELTLLAVYTNGSATQGRKFSIVHT